MPSTEKKNINPLKVRIVSLNLLGVSPRTMAQETASQSMSPEFNFTWAVSPRTTAQETASQRALSNDLKGVGVSTCVILEKGSMQLSTHLTRRSLSVTGNRNLSY